LKALQETVRRSQTDQQTRVIEPLSAVKVGMDDVSSSIAGVQANVTSMRNQQEETRKLVDDIWSAVKIVLKQTEQAPVPVSAAPSPADSAALMFAAAQRDKLTGKADFALQTLFDLSQKYPDSPEAPMAVYEMGELYAANGEYDQALKAFDRVLEQFGDNPMRKDAQFRKAEQLASLGRKADAVKEFNGFAKQFPGDDKAAEALSRVRTLNAPAPAPAKARPKARAK
jgi:TolA-binding protein